MPRLCLPLGCVRCAGVARAYPHQAVDCGIVLDTGDVIATFAVETALLYLDMTVAIPAAPDPDRASLAFGRRVIDGLLGTALPEAQWDDRTYLLKGSGRVPVTAGERAALGDSAYSLLLFS